MQKKFKIGMLLACFQAFGNHAAAAENEQMITDRPDFAESSNVVGKNHFQIETSFAGERSTINGVKERANSTPTLLRFGVSERLELRLETDGRLTNKNPAGTERGYADLSPGLKWHAFDAEGKRPSLGVLVHADLDTGSTPMRGNGIRPSLRLAAEWELPNDLSLGVMPGLAYERNAAGERFVSAVFGIVLGQSWSERLRTFVEISTPRIARANNGGTLANVDFGGAYMLSNTWQVDTGLSRGLNKNTADLAWTVGLSTRF